MSNPNLTHLDYADEAEAAQRAGAWPQAAALWRRAAEEVVRRRKPQTSGLFAGVILLRDAYLAAADRCEENARCEEAN